MGNPSVPGGVDGEQQRPHKVITIADPGYYRMGEAVRTVTCLNGKLIIVDCSGMGSMFQGSLYAPAAKEQQWVHVMPHMLVGGPLQFDVFYSGEAQDDQLLLQDAVKTEASAAAIASMSAGVSHQAEQARAGWTRGC